MILYGERVKAGGLKRLPFNPLIARGVGSNLPSISLLPLLSLPSLQHAVESAPRVALYEVH